MQAISDGIYYEDAIAGVTLGAVVLPSGTLLIDTPLRVEDARSWKSTILTQSRGTHRLLVNLDEHHDRTIGNRFMGLTILAHKNSVDVYKNRTAVFKGQTEETGSLWEKYPEVIGSRWISPNITFNDQIQWGGGEIYIAHHPGPTPGAIWVEVPSKKIVFLGDAVIEDQPPFLANANLTEWIESLSLLRSPKYREYTFISGRSGPVSVDVVRDQHAFLKSTQGRLETLAKRTDNPEETEKMIPAMLSKIKFPTQMKAFYTQRLRYGLYHYFANHHCPSEIQDGA